MRFLRIGDCRGENVLTRVFTSRRFFKNDLKPDGFPLAFEGIMPAQFRVLTGEMTLAAGQTGLRLSHVYDDPADTCTTFIVTHSSVAGGGRHLQGVGSGMVRQRSQALQSNGTSI